MEHLRGYEISVWTLQDSFVTVLKPSNLEFKGQIADPFMNIKDDGEDTLSLKIPMYIRDESGKMVENPLWYNTRNGTIIADLRKLKVIFNKATTSEEVFEFLITNVKEEHEGLKKYCEVECEGLAFHELGKQGYKIALEGGDEIDIEQKKYFDGESDYSECPQPTINYWADRVFKNSNWHYSVQMDWSMHDGITHQIHDILNLDSDNYSSFSVEQRNAFNSWRAENGLRRRDRVYEDSFVSTWKYDKNTDKLIPETITDEREKYRLVEASESNRYNLSQTIAETFQVYCKYKYSYDDNYHIINREVIFYNNFLNESRGIIDLTYKYNTEHLTRIMDATDTVSKMYVRPLKDRDTPTGEALISDAEANKSKEDYLLNFDYLYNIGTITQEQYDEIEPYYTELHKINEELIDIGEKLSIKEKEKIKQEARKTTAEQAMAKDYENISNNDAIARNVTDNKGNVLVTADNAQMLYLIPEDGNKKTYYCNFKSQGIVRNTIHLYWDRELNQNNKKYEMKYEITQYNIENDEFGEVSKVVNINKGTHEQSWIYATFSYSPNTYFKKVSEIYGIRFGQDQAIVNDASTQIAALETEIMRLTDQQNTLLEEKAKIISDFENTMGPALREGTWQPEDEYSNYGEVYGKEIPLKKNDESINGLLSLSWDSELFDDEQDFHYQYGATLQDRYYPCIEITSTLLRELTGKNGYEMTHFLRQLTLIYKNAEDGDEQRIKQYIAINSKMKIAFLRNKNSKVVTPVLMITDAATMDDAQLSLLENTGYLGYISYETETTETTEVITGVITEPLVYHFPMAQWLIKPTEITNNNDYEIVYPRFKINSLSIKSPYTMITVKQQSGKIKENEIKWELLTNYKNFYILPRTSYYTVTIKPEAIFSSVDLNLSDAKLPFLKYKIYYTISKSPLAIYLDAVQVLKENSFPKVSYEIDVMSVNKEFIYDDYSRLGQIAHINDYEFKFENTMGYISELNLDLDRPWQDKIVIKNYKTKFEDIFSTITAQTEQMKKNSATIAMAASAFNSDGTLSSNILGESLMNAILARAADNTVDSSVPSPAGEFMKYDPLIRNELRQVYNEAGEVLAAASKSVEAVAALNLKNADILRSFQVNVAENMTPSVFRDNEAGKRYNVSLNSDTEDFKSGDIWTRKNGSVYTAIQNSVNVQYDTNEDKLKSIKGWAAIKNGQLAISKISGAAINIDTELGQIQLLAGKTIQLLCAGEIELVSNDVKIIGERNVIIGGPDVTIFSTDTAGDNIKGVHIFANKITDTNASKSAVDITGDGIEIAAANGIRMLAGKTIELIASGKATSAISVGAEKGIYLGSSNPIKFFSGDVSSDGSGASVEISNSKILFGVSNADTGTAVQMTSSEIVIGAAGVINGKISGTSISNIGSSTQGSSTLTSYTTGVYIDRSNIKFATGNDYNKSYIHMDSNGITMANTSSISYGSYAKISKEGIILGTSNAIKEDDIAGKKFKDNTDTNYQNYYNNKPTFQVYAPNFIVDSDGTLYANDANIGGTIRADSGYFSGELNAATGTFAGSLSAATGTFSGTLSAACITSGTISADRIGANSISIEKLTGSISNNNWVLNLNAGTFTIGNISANNINTGTISADRIGANSISVGKLTGSISNNGWKLDLNAGTFTIGNISANNINAGTMSAARISGGTLILGGNNNGSGTLRVNNASGNKVVEMDSGGITVYNGSTKQFYIDSSTGNATFAGVLNGTSGLFSGTIKIEADAGIFNEYYQLDSGGFVAYHNQVGQYTQTNKLGINGLELSHIDYDGRTIRCDLYYGGNLYLRDTNINGTDYSAYYYSNGISLYHIDNNHKYFECDINGIYTTGTKSRLVSTSQYSYRLLYCYETPSPLFGDVGEGVISSDGKCYISLDPVFAQTISTDQYQVFLQPYGEGNCYISERHGSYFVVSGTPNLSFGWELKAKQLDFDQLRLERNDEKFAVPRQTYGEDAAKHIQELYNERNQQDN